MMLNLLMGLGLLHSMNTLIDMIQPFPDVEVLRASTISYAISAIDPLLANGSLAGRRDAPHSLAKPRNSA